MKKFGSQIRYTIEEERYTVIERDGPEVVLEDETGKQELWVRHDDHSGYVIEIDGVGYEFVRSLKQEERREQ